MKRLYISPAISIYCLSSQHRLMAGSVPQLQVNTDSVDEVGEAQVLSRQTSSMWDEAWEGGDAYP